jgi:hypothetical protein
MREAFEKWWDSKGYHKAIWHENEQRYTLLSPQQEAWVAWQAAIESVREGGPFAFGDCLNQVRTQDELDRLQTRGDQRYRTYDRPLYTLPT